MKYPNSQTSPQSIDEADTSAAHVAWNLALVAGELRAANRLEARRQVLREGPIPRTETAGRVDDLISWAYGLPAADGNGGRS